MTLMIREENEVEPTPKMTLAERMGYGVKGKQIVPRCRRLWQVAGGRAKTRHDTSKQSETE
jgi:hypothetical protein